jgi:hypothetical protein
VIFKFNIEFFSCQVEFATIGFSKFSFSMLFLKVRRKSGKEYRWWVVIKTYWDKEKKKVRHRVIHNLGRLISLKDITEDSFITSLGEIKIKGSYEYLIVVILDKLWYLWG